MPTPGRVYKLKQRSLGLAFMDIINFMLIAIKYREHFTVSG